MPQYELKYPKEPFSAVKRLPARSSYALETIHTIINTSPLVHVSFNVPSAPFPMTLPMIGAMGSFARPSASTGEVLDLYLHGHVSARLMNTARSSSADEAKEEERQGLPVTVSASLVDGLVLALTPFNHSYNYRSAVLFGHAQLVDDPDEKMWALELLTDKTMPGRWANTRVPPTKAEMQSTGVLKVTITTGSAKIRTGAPHDDKADTENSALVEKVWTGVVPLRTEIAEPVAGPYNEVAQLPGYMSDFVRDANEAAVEYMKEATTKEVPSKADDHE